MKLVGEGFSRNGHLSLKGVAKAVHDDDRPTSFVERVDLYERKSKLALIEHLEDDLAWSLDEARDKVHALVIKVEEELLAAAVVELPEEQPASQTDRLIRLVQGSSATLFRDQLDVAHIAPFGDGTRVIPVDSRATRRWLTNLMYEAERKAPSGEALHTTVLYLEAAAEAQGDRYILDVRVARRGNVAWYDLGSSAVRLGGGQWDIVEQPPILFTRFAHQHPQLAPARGGDVTLLDRFIPAASAEAFLLVHVAIIAGLLPGSPRPMIVLYGPEGSGKTTVAKMLVRVMDPSAVPTIRRIPKPDELAQRFAHTWVAAFDNLSELSTDVQDAMSAAVTGDADIRRVLFTTADDYVMAFRRVLILTGLQVPLTTSDALDRCLLIGLQRIEAAKRIEEEDFWPRFAKALPAILGGAFDVLARALVLLPDVRLAALPRMADFARLGYCIAEAAGWGGGAFISAYERNIAQQHEEAIAHSLVAQAVMLLMEGIREWEGTPTECKQALDALAPQLGIDPQDKKSGWPQDAARLGTAIHKLAPTLVGVGIVTEFGKETHQRKYIFRKDN